MLKDNEVAKRLYPIVKSGEISHISSEQVWSIISADKVENYTSDGPDGDTPFSDLRFKCLALQNVKKYPGKDTGDFYGLSFCINDAPVNSVFLGANGVGKSTLFGALEFMGMRKLNSAVLRGYTKVAGGISANTRAEKTQTDFLTHASSSKDDIRIYLETKDKLLNIEGITAQSAFYPIVCDAFYCSDYDVRVLETCQDYSQFLLSQLGMENYMLCLRHLYYSMVKIEEARQDLNTIIADAPDNTYICEVNAKLAVSLGVIRKPSKMLADKNIKDINQWYKDIISGTPDSRGSVGNLLNSIRRESRLFPEENPLTESVWKLYDDAIKALSDLITQIGDNPDETVKIPDSLSSFFESRNKIVGAIRNVCRKLNEESGNSRDSLISDHLKEYNALNIENYILSKRLDKIPKILQSAEGYSSTVGNMKNLILWLEEKLEEKLKEWLPKIKEAISSLLQEYFDPDNDIIDIKYQFTKYDQKISLPLPQRQGASENFLKFEIKILSSAGCLDSGTNFYPKDPREYLNTFKYKLFCVALKMAFCCVAKDLYHINFPLIIDDVFDASDFDNRIRLKEFVINLFQNHDALMANHKSTTEDYSLQLIFFTQDDLIADQVDKGLRYVCVNPQMVKFGHIFDYHEIIFGSKDKICDESADKKLELKNPEDKTEKYGYYPLDDTAFPDNLPNQRNPS